MGNNMFTLPEVTRAIYWDRGKRSQRIGLLMKICEDWLREQRANHFIPTKQQFLNQRGKVYDTHIQQPGYTELTKQLEEEQKPLTIVEQDLLTAFEARVINALSNGIMLELSDFQKFKNTKRL